VDDKTRQMWKRRFEHMPDEDIREVANIGDKVRAMRRNRPQTEKQKRVERIMKSPVGDK